MYFKMATEGGIDVGDDCNVISGDPDPAMAVECCKRVEGDQNFCEQDARPQDSCIAPSGSDMASGSTEHAQYKENMAIRKTQPAAA